MFKIIPVGDLGKDRDKFVRLHNKKVGKGNWFWGFKAKNNLYSWDLGMQMYEDAYWNYFRCNINALKGVLRYSDVIVGTSSDVDSGLDYRCQQEPESHYEDIAIRRSLRRMGVWFKGETSRYLKIGSSPLSSQLVKFHLKHLLDQYEDDCVNSWILNHRVVIIADEIIDQQKLSDILIR